MFADVMDDLRGGPKTQALVWADMTLRRVTESFSKLGASSGSSFDDLCRMDAGLALQLAEASVLVRRANPSQVPTQFRERCEAMAASSSNVLDRSADQP